MRCYILINLKFIYKKYKYHLKNGFWYQDEVLGIVIILIHCKFFMIGFDKVKEEIVMDKLILFLAIYNFDLKKIFDKLKNDKYKINLIIFSK